MSALALLLCVGLIAFAAGAIHGWVAGWIAASHGWLARLVRLGDPKTPPPKRKD